MNTLYRTVTGQSQQSTQSGSQRPQPPNLSRHTTTDPLTGTLNHLSEAQEQTLVEFKNRLEKEGWWTPDGINGKPSHDDGTLLRYLRARKFDVSGAVGQFSDTEKWMKEQHVEELYEHFDVDFYERARKMYPQWTGHRDKRGIPIYVYEVKGLDSKAVSKYQKESEAYKSKLPDHKSLSTPAKLIPLFALYHNLLNFVLPMCSSMERPNPEMPITNSTNIVDITGVGLGQFWNLKQHMQDASVLATAHYPETLDRIFIIGAPSFFPTVWGWIKRWFDPVTVSKIFILSKAEIMPTLSSFMDMDSIPKKYGGQLDWGWGDLPHMGKEELAAVESDGQKGWVPGPCLWLQHERIVVGSQNGKLRRSDKEVAEKKPIVYAADYTEEPVHEDRRKSSVASSTASKTNGKATEPNLNKRAVLGAQAAATDRSRPTTPAAAAAATTTTTHNRQLSPGSTLSSPSGDSQVHLPDSQPAHPATTAEYISQSTTQRSPPASSSTHQNHAVAPTNAAPTPAPSSPPTKRSSVVHAHPPSQPLPGPLTPYQIEMQKAIAAKMQGESVSVIPSSSGANGDIPHPEVLVSSDPTKGLAIEAEKLRLGDAQNGHAGRPGIERFVTAKPF